MRLVAELVGRLKFAHPRITCDASGALLEFDAPPVRLHVDADALERHLTSESMRSAAHELWPGTDPLQGALNLLNIHIEGLLGTRKPGQNTLVIDADHGVRWQLTDDEAAELAEWEAEERCWRQARAGKLVVRRPSKPQPGD